MRIVIDGNIGSGKTTQLSRLEKLNFQVQCEPIDKWPLDLLYEDIERWGLTFQLVVLQTFTKDDSKTIIYERCPLTSKNVFWSVMNKNDVEASVYEFYYDKHGWGPELYILIDKPADLCMEHIKQRDQSGDGGVTLDYLYKLEKQYKNMFDNLDCPKYIIDGKKSIHSITSEIVALLVKYGYLGKTEADEKLTLMAIDKAKNILGEIPDQGV